MEQCQQCVLSNQDGVLTRVPQVWLVRLGLSKANTSVVNYHRHRSPLFDPSSFFQAGMDSALLGYYNLISKNGKVSSKLSNPAADSAHTTATAARSENARTQVKVKAARKAAKTMPERKHAMRQDHKTGSSVMTHTVKVLPPLSTTCLNGTPPHSFHSGTF